MFKYDKHLNYIHSSGCVTDNLSCIWICRICKNFGSFVQFFYAFLNNGQLIEWHILSQSNPTQILALAPDESTEHLTGSLLVTAHMEQVFIFRCLSSCRKGFLLFKQSFTGVREQQVVDGDPFGSAWFSWEQTRSLHVIEAWMEQL